MKCPAQNHSQVYEQKGALPTENWHLPSTSTKIKSWPLQLLTFNSPEKNSGWKSGKRHSVLWEKMAEQAFIWLDLFRRRFYESQFLHLLIPRETLTSLMVTSALSIKENFTIKSQNRVAMVQTTREITRWLVQFNCCRVRLFATPWIKACQASLSITNSHSLLKPMSIASVMPSNHLILCRPLLLLPPIPPSIRVFSNESTLRIRWLKYWSFSFSISPSNEHPGLISSRMDWLDLLAVQGTLKRLLQHHSSKASILWHSAFLTVQLSHPHMTTGKTIALTSWTFVGKVMSLLFNMLSRLVITFFPRIKHLLISDCNNHLQWFWSPKN